MAPDTLIRVPEMQDAPPCRPCLPPSLQHCGGGGVLERKMAAQKTPPKHLNRTFFLQPYLKKGVEAIREKQRNGPCSNATYCCEIFLFCLRACLPFVRILQRLFLNNFSFLCLLVFYKYSAIVNEKKPVNI